MTCIEKAMLMIDTDLFDLCAALQDFATFGEDCSALSIKILPSFHIHYPTGKLYEIYPEHTVIKSADHT